MNALTISTALLLGLVGSLHCAGMCGPLALALPNAGRTPLAFYLGRVGYNVGRVTAYGLLGLVFGLIGQTAALAGFQRWACFISGAVLLLAVLPGTRASLGWSAAKAMAFVKSGFGAVLQRRTVGSLYVLGVLNGFLPCGLVYAACAGAVTVGSVAGGVGYMVLFGAGTVPMMFGISLVRRTFPIGARLGWGRFVPVCIGLMGVLLIVRGLGLGIPYLSPDLSKCH